LPHPLAVRSLRAPLDRNVWRVYVAVLLLGIAYGLSVAVIALHLDARGFHERAIGELAVWFASGIVLLAIPSGKLVSRFGGKRVLTCALVGYAASVVVFPMLHSYAAIGAARFVDGACSVCAWVSCETILLRRSNATNKAQVMSLYAMAIAIGYVLGPIFANAIAHVFPLTAAFYVSGVIALASASYVALRLEPEARDADESAPVHGGALHATVKTRARDLLARIKTSCFATFAYGYFEASVVLFLPLYLAHEKGIAREQTIAIPAFFAAGMLLFSNVAGRFGDRFGHLLVMRVLASIGGAMVLGFVVLSSFPSMAVAVFVAGATLASISPVSLALQGVVTERRDYDRANAIYNAFYAAGILIGPPVSSLVFARFGGAAMLVHLALMWASFVVFAAVFAADDPASRARRPEAARAIAFDPPSSPSLDV
jgi:MFS family permease